MRSPLTERFAMQLEIEYIGYIRYIGYTRYMGYIGRIEYLIGGSFCGSFATSSPICFILHNQKAEFLPT